MTKVDVQFVDLQSKCQFDNCTEFLYGAKDEDRISINNKIIQIYDKDGNYGVKSLRAGDVVKIAFDPDFKNEKK